MSNVNAIFTQPTPATVTMTIGGSHVYMWLKLGAPWVNEVAAYSGGINQQIQVQKTGQTMEGQFNSADGAFTWSVRPSVATPGAVDWQIVGTPTGGTSNVQGGTV